MSATRHRIARPLSRRQLLAASVGAAALTLGQQPTVAAEPVEVDLLLVLAADVSRSVDSRKFALQREGYAAAIRDADVMRAIGRGRTQRIAITYLEWSGVGEQEVILDWTMIATAEHAEEATNKILATPRPFASRTSIGAAIEKGLEQLSLAPFKAPRSLIDLSGDGTHNSGFPLEDARRAATARDVGINAVVILSEKPLPFNPAHTHPPDGLLAWFESNVITGEGAFAIVAENFESFRQSIRQKLIREIS